VHAVCVSHVVHVSPTTSLAPLLSYIEKNTDPVPVKIGDVFQQSNSAVVELIFHDDFDVRLVSDLSRKKSVFGNMYRTKTVKGR
jgi:myosin heavy subunit